MSTSTLRMCLEMDAAQLGTLVIRMPGTYDLAMYRCAHVGYTLKVAYRAFSFSEPYIPTPRNICRVYYAITHLSIDDLRFTPWKSFARLLETYSINC